MTAPTPPVPVGTQNFGPGQLTIGETGEPFDCSSLINGCILTPSTETADSTTKLSGYVRGGSSTTTWTLAGNVDTDAANESGLWQQAYDADGAEVPFSFVPQFGGPTVAGSLKLAPLRLGGDAYGDDLTADFEWTIVGKPVITRDAPAGLMAADSPAGAGDGE